MIMNWDDLRIFLAIARFRSLTAAGRELGVSQPTVSRRLAAMEESLGVRLFDRSKQGYELSTPGLEIFETVQHVEQELSDISRRVFGQDRRLTGSLRVTCTAVMADLYLAAHLSRFLEQHPGIDLSVICTFQHLSLSRREADVALRVTSQPPDSLVGRRLAKVALGVYAAAAKARDLSEASSRRDWDWIGWQDETYNRMMIAGSFPDARIKHRVDDLQAMRSLARHGSGVAVLPCYMGDLDAGLRRVVPTPIEEGAPELWLLCHPDVRRVARVRLFMDFIAEVIQSDRELFEGRRPISN
jgi:DNA-binding transcriptional LysR family regulator